LRRVASGARARTPFLVTAITQLTRDIDRLTIELHNRLVGKAAQ
jgi:hypothetical protein